MKHFYSHISVRCIASALVTAVCLVLMLDISAFVPDLAIPQSMTDTGYPLRNNAESYVDPSAEESSDAVPIISFPRLLGVSVCASSEFVRRRGDRIVLARPVASFPDASEEMLFRPCTMRGPLRESSTRRVTIHEFAKTGGITAPYTAPHADALVEAFCFYFKLTSACTSELNATECEELGGINIVSHFRPRSHVKSSTAEGRVVGPHVIFILLDSVSYHAYTTDLAQTRSFLRSHYGARYTEHAHAASVGFQSAVNHAALLLGAGSVPQKCALFKTRREGIPQRRDGEAYEAYRRVSGKVFQRAPPAVDFSGSWLRIGAPNGSGPRRLRTIYYPIPQPAWEASCLGLYDEESFYSYGIADVVQWRFFNEAVKTVNREINGSQGCIGQTHSVDFMWRHARLALRSATEMNVAATVLLAEQTPHQAEWHANRAMEYFDTRFSSMLKHLHGEGLLDNAVLLLGGDHGRSYAVESRAAILDRSEEVLNPLVAWAIGRRVVHGDRIASELADASRYRSSHFDLHATLSSMLRGSALRALSPRSSVVERSLVETSLLDGGDQLLDKRAWSNRTCDEMGLFSHACRFDAAFRPMSQAEQRSLIDRIRWLVDSVNSAIVKYNAPCATLAPPLALADHTVKILDHRFASSVATVLIQPKTSRAGGSPLVFRVETKVERTRSGTLQKMEIRTALRVSPYRDDELRCGLTLARLKQDNSRSRGTQDAELNASAGPIDVQFCACTAGVSKHDTDVFVGA